MFVLVMNFVNDCLVPPHTIIVKPLLKTFQLTIKVILYMKNEGSNMGMLNSALAFVVSCKFLDLWKPYIGTCFTHFTPKCCKFATSEDKVCMEMGEVSLKNVQTTLHEIITWTKNIKNGRQ
jgi:hypothetical protein